MISNNDSATPHPWENATLGQDDQKHLITRASEQTECISQLCAQSSQQIDVFSYSLDPMVLNHRSIELQMSAFARKNRQSMIRLLIIDPLALQSVNHRLVSLSQNLSSFVSIRVVPDDYKNIPYNYMLFDRYGYIYKSIHTQLEATVCFKDTLKVKELHKEFDEIWQLSRIASEFRALGI